MDMSGLVPKAGVNRGPGSPYSKGTGDAWYHRGFNPQYHKFERGTTEYSEYSEGYNDMWDLEAGYPGGGKQYDESVAYEAKKEEKPAKKSVEPAAKSAERVASTQVDIRGELDPVSQELISIARAKYPNAKSDLGAVIKLMQRSMSHGKESDTAQDKTIKDLQRKVVDLERRIQELERNTQQPGLI